MPQGIVNRQERRGKVIMAVNRVPVLKRCRALGLEPSYLGYDKEAECQGRQKDK